MEINLGNLGGTIMRGDRPLLQFKFKRGQLVYCESVCTELKLLPFEFATGALDAKTLKNFFGYRIVPETRQGLQEKLAASSIEYYDAERIIRLQAGRCIDDLFWLRCD